MLKTGDDDWKVEREEESEMFCVCVGMGSAGCTCLCYYETGIPCVHMILVLKSQHAGHVDLWHYNGKTIPGNQITRYIDEIYHVLNLSKAFPVGEVFLTQTNQVIMFWMRTLYFPQFKQTRELYK